MIYADEQKLRDSGISMTDDDSQQSLSTSTSSISDCKSNTFSYVQSLRQRFEKINDGIVHTACNWWLEEVNEDEEHNAIASKINDATNVHIKADETTVEDLYSDDDAATREEPKFPAPKLTRHSSIPPPVPARPLSRIISVDRPVSIAQIEVESDHSSDNHSTDSFDSDSDDNGDDDDTNDEAEETIVMRNSLTSSRPTSTTPSVHSNFSHSKLFNILGELFENEKNYVKTLKSGIENYMNVMDREHLPKSLRGQKYHIFANIEGIYNFHKNEFLPALLACDEDEPMQVAEIFTRCVAKEYFYSYVIYAINRKRSELLCKHSMDFWREIQNECGDRLGINSFLLQPIQRLPRYQLLLNEIIKDLSKDIENTKQAIAAFCVAEKSLQRLLDTVNSSMSITDIKNCDEIDVLCQGKFRKVNEFDMFDLEARRTFRGKVFLFENCIVYTEALSREFMNYRGHFDMNSVGIICKDGEGKFKLFARQRGIKEVKFKAGVNIISEWNELITAMLMKFVKEEKSRNEIRRKSRIHVKSRASASDSLRSSMMSIRSDISHSSLDSARMSGDAKQASGDFFVNERRNSQWYI